MPLATAFAAVSSSGALCERRCQGCLRRTEWRVRDRRRDGERVHEPGRHVGEDGDRGTADEDDAGDVREEQDPLARIAIAEHPRERSGEGGRDEAGEDEEADSTRSADSVGIDGDGDEERVVTDDRGRPGELEPAEVRVAPDGREGRYESL